jgi:hypothetical protein
MPIPPAFPRAADPVQSVPIRFPAITLPAPAAVPPIAFPLMWAGASANRNMPARFGIAAVPAAFVPT